MCPPRDMSSILFNQYHPEEYCKAPKDSHVSVCKDMGRGMYEDIYHGGGYLPTRFDDHTRVLCPCPEIGCVCWGIRRLQLAEVLLANDWPMLRVVATERCVSRHCLFGRRWVQELVPGRCLIEGYISFRLAGFDASTSRCEGPMNVLFDIRNLPIRTPFGEQVQEATPSLWFQSVRDILREGRILG